VKKPRAVSKTFKGTLERMPGNLGWVIVRIPLDVPKVWGVRGHFRVRGEVNGLGFRGALFPTKRGYHFLLVNRKLQKDARIGPGTTAKFRVEPDLEKRTVRMPVELARMLKQSRAIARFYSELNPSARGEIARMIAMQKTPAGRERHAERLAEHLLETLEAERELPPLIRRAFDANPRAWQGWRSMTPKQRRHELLSITYYRTPEARQRRLEKVVAWALKRAEKTDSPRRQGGTED
jgi:uncharacterized protein YdeI (YjbR/CyaY-like superfamily)